MITVINNFEETFIKLTISADKTLPIFEEIGFEDGIYWTEELKKTIDSLMIYSGVDMNKSKDSEKIAILFSRFVACLCMHGLCIQRSVRINFEKEIKESTRKQIIEIYNQIKGIEIESMLKNKDGLLTKEQIRELKSEVKFKLEHGVFIESSQPNQIDEKQKEVFTFENNFDNTPPEDVYYHFKAGLVDKKHIDLETLETFLKQAFSDYKEDEPSKDKLRMKNTKHKIGYIRGVFHKYFLKQTLHHSEKSKYVKLLTDNFIDFEYQKTHDNFRS